MNSELDAEYVTLAELLRRRVHVIQDSALREHDPDSQLAQLREVGEALFASQARLKGRIPGRLEHFLTQCSYDKALAFIEEERGETSNA